MPPNQTPQNLGLALAQMNQGGVPQFSPTQTNPQQLRGMQPPAPASYSYQPQGQMSQMQLSPTQQSFYMPQQQQANPLGDAFKGMAASLNKINQQNQNKQNQNQGGDPSQPEDPYQAADPYQGYPQPDYGTMMSNYGGPGIFGS